MLAVNDRSNDQLGIIYVAKYLYEVRVGEISIKIGNIDITIVNTTTTKSIMSHAYSKELFQITIQSKKTTYLA